MQTFEEATRDLALFMFSLIESYGRGKRNMDNYLSIDLEDMRLALRESHRQGRLREYVAIEQEGS